MSNILIKDWDDLRQIPRESKTHILKVGECNAFLKAKEHHLYNDDIQYLEQVSNLHVYLSTHTFYEDNYKFYSKVLQKCGFDVELVSWDV